MPVVKSRKFSERLFLAVELPRFAREQIVELRKTWRKQLEEDVRWVPPLNLNLPLRYLGELDVSKSKQLCTRLDTLAQATPAFQLSVDKVSASPSHSEAKIFWLGLKDSQELRALLNGIEECCFQLRLPKDKKPFEPRINLSRTSEPQKLPPLQVKELKGFKVKNFVLIEGRLGQSGPTYHQLRKFELQAN